MKRANFAVVPLVFAVTLVFVTGCSSFGFSFSALAGPRQQRTESTQRVAVKETPPPKQSVSRSREVYQVQFDTVYSSLWTIGWLGYRDHRYKPGQGTVWEIRSQGRGSDRPMTLERAFLRVNADGTQWWRLRVESDGDVMVFEFLVDADEHVWKVRYRDPDSRAVEEFVPARGNSSGGRGGPRSRADLSRVKTEKQTVRVKAGGFGAEHYVLKDESGEVEGWVSDSVPGYMVKTVYKSSRDNTTSTGELVRIEIGITTELGSY